MSFSLYEDLRQNIRVGVNSRHTESLGIKPEGDTLENKGFENLLHIPGNLESQMHSQDKMHAEKRPDKHLCFHYKLIFQLSETRK